MYEGNILNLGTVAPLRDTDIGADGLHALSWAELVARLGAARDYHRFANDAERFNQGSFHCASAYYIASFGQEKPGINPFALADHKVVKCIGSDTPQTELTGDRGRQ